MTIRRIAAAVDASEPARRAAERALSLAGHTKAETTLVHVYDAGPAEASTILAAEGIVERNREAGKRDMKALVAELGAPETPTLSRLGHDVPGTICEAARELEADLLVVGTIGRTGVSRFFLGSVAENVMRRAHCPVWVERPSDPVIGDVNRLVVCTDLSPFSEAALSLSAELAAELGCTVELVYAFEAPYRGLSIDVRRDLIAELREQLTQLGSKYFEGSAPRVTIVEGANVVDGITAHASRISADLLVLASHGRTGLSRVFMGSVAERVARFAPCSVLVARSPVERSTQGADGG